MSSIYTPDRQNQFISIQPRTSVEDGDKGGGVDGRLDGTRTGILDTKHVRALHERFVADPEHTDLSSLRPIIARSWRRSLQWNVNPDLRTFEKFREPRVDDQTLQAAAPVLAELERLASDTGVSIYLADQNSTIAILRGTSVAIRGGAMSEDVFGTNSDGTAIEEGGAVQVWGAEHFCTGMQHLYCASVPILDPLRRSVRAVLSLSIPERLARDADARSMVLIAHGAAAQFSQILASRLAVREQALLSSYLAEVRKRGTDSVIAMDDRTTIASKGALQQLSQEDYAVLAGYARESERLSQTVERQVSLGMNTIYTVQARPITSAGETIGSVLRLREPPPSPELRRRTSVRHRTDRFDAVIGESLPLRRALELASTVVRRRLAAYILGERGTGKTLLAEAMAKQLADHSIVFDCAQWTSDARDSSSLVEQALSTGNAVVLKHVDALSLDATASLTDIFRAQDSPRVVMTMRRLRDDLIGLTSALEGIEIEMPPLRNRRDDIPLLVAHILASAAHGVMRVSPGLLGSLTETEWSGNVAQLKEFVDIAAARCNFSELGVQHLSDAHQKVIARRPLTRLEEAELQQIREVLTDTAGNRVRAAEILQIGRSTLYRKIETYTRRGFNLEG